MTTSEDIELNKDENRDFYLQRIVNNIKILKPSSFGRKTPDISKGKDLILRKK